MKTLDKVLLFVAIFDVSFIICMIIIFCIKDAIPDTLVTCVLGSCAVELLLSAWITVVKKKEGVTNDE